MFTKILHEMQLSSKFHLILISITLKNYNLLKKNIILLKFIFKKFNFECFHFKIGFQ